MSAPARSGRSKAPDVDRASSEARTARRRPYPPAAEPYRTQAPPTETIGQLKSDVLTAFALKEGPQPDGSNVSYTLYFGKTPLENVSELLGALAGHSDELQFKLSQQITQGAT